MFLQIFVLLIVLATFWYVKRRQKLQVLAKNGIPSAPCSLIYGHINDRYKKNVPKAGEWHAKYGDIFGYYLGTLPMVSVLDVELLKRIQVKDFDKFTDRVQSVRGGPDPLERFGDSLVQLRGQRWKEVRSILRSTFSSSKLRDTVPMVHDAIEALLDNLKAKSREGTDFNIYPLLQGLTMDTIGRSAFGVNTEVQRNPDDPFLTAAHALFNDQRGKLAAVPTVLVLLFPEFASILHPLRCLVERFRCWSGTSPNKIMFDVSQKIVNQRRKMGKDPQNPWSRNDLLQRMLEAGISNNEMSSNMEQLAVDNDNATNDPVEASLTRSTLDAHKLTENEVVANSVLFFEAGFETTSTLLAFLFHVLVNQQDIQDKIRQEVTDLHTRSGHFDYNTVTELKYMDCVINETMRVYPPVSSFITRRALEDYKYNDITIPKGAGIVVPVYQIHHDARYWPEPETFDPDRFAHGKVNPITWQPFGAGPRNCIGMRFAILEVKLALAVLLSSFKIVPGPRTEIGNIAVDYKVLTMCPKNGVYVKVEPLK